MKTKKIALSALVEIIPYILIGALGILKVRILISNIGSDLNGYYQFVNQIISYLFLAEMGFTGAVIFKLYTPFANNDKKSIGEIYRGARKIFKSIGFVIVGLIFGGTILFPTLFGINNEFSFQVIMCYLLISLSYTLPYFFYSYTYNTLFCADQKKYIYSLIINIMKLLCDLFVILVVLKFPNLIAIALVIVVIKIIEEIIVSIIGKRVYSYIEKEGIEDTSARKMTKDVVWHYVGYLVINNVDSVLIMMILGPISVSIYAAYNFISRFLSEVATKIDNVILHFFGGAFVKEKKERVYSMFKEQTILIAWLALTISFTYLIGIRGFVGLWVDDPSVNYILNYFTTSMFAFSLFLVIVYSPLHAMIYSNGLYKESKYYIMIACLINIVLSVILMQTFPGDLKIAGALVATAISFFVTIILRSGLISRMIFTDVKKSTLINRYLKYIVFFVIGMVGCYYVEPLIYDNANNIFSLVAFLVVSFLIFGIINILVLHVTDKDTINLLRRLKSLVKRRKEEPNEAG